MGKQGVLLNKHN